MELMGLCRLDQAVTVIELKIFTAISCSLPGQKKLALNMPELTGLLIDILGNALALQRKQTRSLLNLKENCSD